MAGGGSGPWNLFCGCCGDGEPDSDLSASRSRNPTAVTAISSEDVSFVSRKMSASEEKQFLDDLYRVKTNTMPVTPQLIRSEEGPWITLSADADQQVPSASPTQKDQQVPSASPTQKEQGELLS